MIVPCIPFHFQTVNTVRICINLYQFSSYLLMTYVAVAKIWDNISNEVLYIGSSCQCDHAALSYEQAAKVCYHPPPPSFQPMHTQSLPFQLNNQGYPAHQPPQYATGYQNPPTFMQMLHSPPPTWPQNGQPQESNGAPVATQGCNNEPKAEENAAS